MYTSYFVMQPANLHLGGDMPLLRQELHVHLLLCHATCQPHGYALPLAAKEQRKKEVQAYHKDNFTQTEARGIILPIC